MGTKKLTFSDAPEVLFEFEKKCFAELEVINIEGWSLWQICKIHVFYDFITEAVSGGGNKMNSQRGNKPLQLLKHFMRTLGHLSKKKRVLIFTNTVDKLSRDENGIYYNSLIDPILDLKLLDRPLIIERPRSDGFLMPARHPWHIDRQLLYYYASIKDKVLRKKVANYEDQCADLVKLLNNFLLENNYSDRVNLRSISDVVSLFVREKDFFVSFFKKRQPPFVLGSECMGTGLMAAALELQIPFIELQHGSIDQYYPPYVWDKRFLNLKKVFKPTQLWVFGQLAKEIVCTTGFFKDEDVKLLGYKKIEDIRSLTEQKGGEDIIQGQVLVVVQPMMHNFNKELIRTLLSVKLDDVEFVFKAHPLQADHELQEYIAMMQGSKIKILDKAENIHKLILKSDLVVGHVTTCLEEALSLGKPSFTIATTELPQGLHSMNGTGQLKDVIVPVFLSELSSKIENFYTDEHLRVSWIQLLCDKKNIIYCNNYSENVTDALNRLGNKIF